MKLKGEIYEQKDGFLLPKYCGFVTAKITRLNKTFGFAKDIKTDEEIFIPGKFLKGAMPDDTVTLKTYESNGNSLEGEVVNIVNQDFSRFTGNIAREFDTLCVIPDIMAQYALPIENLSDFEVKEGDKVLCEIAYRGTRHSEHTCRIISNFGSSEKASVCAMSVLEINGISLTFPDSVIEEAKRISDMATIQKEAPNRLDLRDEIIFTIDGADTKDIDDAISIKKSSEGYELGVHIADVSYYVKPKSELDNEALNRGTSVYYANKVIPMLPPELSNGICSLNPQEDRLAFSALMKIDFEGALVDYKFVKTIIRSRVKGVYSEINTILAGTQTPDIDEKYKEVKDSLKLMNELAKILKRNRKMRGAPELESSESKLIINEDDFCVDVKPRTRGESEEIIEDFMLMANEAAAKLARENELPFVYRIHEDPGVEKINTLEETLKQLGVTFPPHKSVKPKHLAMVVDSVKGTELEMVVNNLVLRSMAKAKYSPEPIGHFGLVLDDYAHFTSPIRRYPDLSIHRIMSDFLSGTTQPELMKKYQKFVHHSSQASSEAELTAMKVERDCEDCYKAEYMKNHLGEEFDGRIVSVLDSGFFVELDNTCEGMVPVEELPAGEYVFDGSMKLTNTNNDKSYRIGDKIKIKVLRADVSSGKVDFGLAE
jgi:ribonuclease R